MSQPTGTGNSLLQDALLHGKYRLLRLIGKGGFGTVYEAKDERGAGNRVAIKVVNAEYSRDERLVRAFRAEARRMTRLSHPNIVDWKNFDADESGICYFVMELVEGEELDKLLTRKGPIPHDRVARILLQVLDALRAAHQLAEGGSVLHLDLKPRNVFLVPPRANRPEQVKVIDFGIGQHVGEDADEGPAIPGGPNRLETAAISDFNPTTLRFHDATFDDPPGLRRCQGCTPEYASPEQAAHVLGLPNVLQLDGRSDLYSLGVMAYQMLTGELPFARPVLRTDYLRLHVSGQPRPISASRVKLPRNLARFVERCLAKDRDGRFPDAHAAHAALERIVRPPVALRAAVAGVVLVGAAFAFGGWIVRAGETGRVVAVGGGDARPFLTGWFGPTHTRERLEFQPTDLVEPGDELELVQASDGVVVTGSRITIVEPGRLDLEIITPLGEGRVARRVRIEGAGARFEPFELVWLGAKAWELQAVRAGAFDLRGQPRRVDTRGLSLEVELAGDGRNDVENVWLSDGDTEDAKPLDLVASGSQGDRRSMRADLGLLAFAAGRTKLELHARDRAGREHVEEIEFDVLHDDVGLESVELCEPRVDGSCHPFVRLAGRWLLPPDGRVRLKARTTRPARVEWRLVHDERAANEIAWTPVEARSDRDVDLDLAQLGAEAARSIGTVQLRLDEGPHVARASSRGSVIERVSFEISSDRATFQAFLSGDQERELVDGETRWVNTEHLEFRFRPHGRTAMKLVSLGKTTILEPGAAEFSQSVALGDGIHPMEIHAYRFDTSEDSVADRPDKEMKFWVGVDRVAPLVSIPTGIQGITFRDRESLARALVFPIPDDPGSPVELSWTLESKEQKSSGSWANDIGGTPVSTSAEPFRSPESHRLLVDGDYRLVLNAVDRARNRATAVEAGFRVACDGPTVTIESPRMGNWSREPEGWLVQFRAEDANGIGTMECFVESVDGERLQVKIERLGYSIFSRAVGEKGRIEDEPHQFRGYAELPHDWSRKDARLVLKVSDSEDQATTKTIHGLSLPYIPAPKPVALRASNLRGPTMRLVPGNSGGVYQFGGRGDDVENAAHRKASLESFAPLGTSRSWNVAYAAGTIADFYLDEREVTRREFLAFVRAPDGWPETEHFFHGHPPAPTRRAELEGRLASDPTLPATGVTWDEAAAFAHWAGRRLPTWVELEYAMRGGPSNYRPFAGFAGRSPGPNEVNARGLGPGRGWSAGMGGDVTPDTAIRDLAGNVREWTSTPIALVGDRRPSDPAAYFDEHKERLLLPVCDAETTAFWIAGGSYARKNYFFESATTGPRNACADDLGFRCALSLEAARDAMESRRLEETQ